MKKQKICAWGIMAIMTCTIIGLQPRVEVVASETENAEYEYDKLGRVIKISYQNGSVITYEYDKNGNIVSVKTDIVDETVEDEGGEDWEEDDRSEEEAGGGDDGGMSSNQAGAGSGGGNSKGIKDRTEPKASNQNAVSGDVVDVFMQVLKGMKNPLETIIGFLERIFDTIEEFVLGRMRG